MITDANFATSLSRYFGSGLISRLGMSRRRLIVISLLRALDAVLRATLRAGLLVRVGGARRAGGVERAADDVVAHAREVLNAATADEHDAVLLEVVTLTRDVRGGFDAVREAHAGDLAERRVRLLRRGRVHARAH